MYGRTWFYWPETADGDYPGDRTNFGYNMKYNKNGQRVIGRLLLIRHMADGSTYRVKSNALDGLALGNYKDGGETVGWASFKGKATYLEPGWLGPKGNYSFIVYVEDHGDSGAGTDKIWIKVQEKDDNRGGLVMNSPTVLSAILLQGGNIVVPH